MIKYVIAIILSTLLLAGCDDRPRGHQSYVVKPDTSREAYCRSIGLYKEWDSNDCETFADAYDLDEDSDEYKRRKNLYYSRHPQYDKYKNVRYTKDTVILNQADVIAAQNAKIKKQQAELKRQQEANRKKNELLKAKRSAEIKKVQDKKASSYSKSQTSSYSKSSSSTKKN